MIQHKSQIEQIAIKFLEFIAAEPEIALNFFTVTGLQPQNLRNCMNEEFMRGIIHYLMEDENLLLKFSKNMNIKLNIITNLYAFLMSEHEL